MAAPVFVSGSVNSAAITTGTSATVSSTGTTPQKGNLQIVFLAVGGASRPTAITPPAGWNTLLATTATASSSPLISVAVFWRIAPATAAFSGSFTWTGTATSGEWLFTEWAGQGALAIDGAAVTSVNATSTSPTSPSVTPANGRINDTLVCALAAGATGATTIVIPSGMSSVLAHAGASGTQLFGCASLALASASATSAETWTLGTTTLTFGISFLIQQAGPFNQTQITGTSGERQSPPSHQLYFQFPNLALSPTNFQFRAPLITRQAPTVPPIDFKFPNLTQFAPTNPIVNHVFDRSPLPSQRVADFLFPNILLTTLTFGIPFEFRAPFFTYVPAQPRLQDFQPPNIAVTGVVAAPVRSPIFDQHPPQQQSQDQLPPNVSLLDFSQRQVKPVGVEIDETKPAPVAQPQDQLPPNLSVLAAAQLQVKPVAGALPDAVPLPQPRQLDFSFPNLTPETVVAAKPSSVPIFDRPVVTLPPPDNLFPNLLTTTLTVVAVPVRSPIFDRPLPSLQLQDFQPPNIALLNFAQLQVKPVGTEIDESVPAPTIRQQDQLPPNIAFFASTVRPLVNFSHLFARPVATSLPIDAPIPNPFTTTLSVAPAKPFSNLLFERAPAPTVPQDNAPPNLLVTILSTPVGIPFLPNIFLMADRPSPQSPPQDQAPVNLTINLPPGAIKATAVDWLVRARRRGMRQGGR